MKRAHVFSEEGLGGLLTDLLISPEADSGEQLSVAQSIFREARENITKSLATINA